MAGRCETVKSTGAPAVLAVPEPAGDRVAGESLPEVQESETVTLAVLLSSNCFLTWKVAVLSVLTMVQVPTLRVAAQVPLEV